MCGEVICGGIPVYITPVGTFFDERSSFFFLVYEDFERNILVLASTPPLHAGSDDTQYFQYPEESWRMKGRRTLAMDLSTRCRL